MTIKVGEYEVREVSELNNELYKKAEEILEDKQHKCHIGWSGVGDFIDWIESNYDLVKKNT